ncbi:hypothetical protein P5V15_015788 [Pogonomyrmex californicus]
MLGDKKFDVDKDDSIIIDNRLSDEATFTKDDKQTYKSILLTTNAHRRGHSVYNPIMGNKRYKYINIIAPLISTYKKSGKKGAAPRGDDSLRNYTLRQGKIFRKDVITRQQYNDTHIYVYYNIHIYMYSLESPRPVLQRDDGLILLMDAEGRVCVTAGPDHEPVVKTRNYFRVIIRATTLSPKQRLTTMHSSLISTTYIENSKKNFPNSTFTFPRVTLAAGLLASLSRKERKRRLEKKHTLLNTKHRSDNKSFSQFSIYRIYTYSHIVYRIYTYPHK